MHIKPKTIFFDGGANVYWSSDINRLGITIGINNVCVCSGNTTIDMIM